MKSSRKINGPVLGIETSCDETAAAIYDAGRGILAERVYSQIKLHEAYGGVVPELASRDHARRLLPLIREVMNEAGVTGEGLGGVAYTAGPGLMGALMVGAATGHALARGWSVPAIPVHHLEGHLLAPLLDKPAPAYPFLALLVSGGHTMLMRVEGLGRYEILGETLDDAVGEAFDKTALLLGLNYPGGPALEALAVSGRPIAPFPRPMTDRPGLDFSFSGLKTFTMNAVRQSAPYEGREADIARAFQEAVFDTLVIKCRRALKQTGLKRLVIAGGVGANQALRDRMQRLADDEGVTVYFPARHLCTDNAAMIAHVGTLILSASPNGPDFGGSRFFVRPRWGLSQ